MSFEDIQNAINAAYHNDAVTFKDNLNIAIQDKVAAAIEAKKMEIATSLVTGQQVEDDLEDEVADEVVDDDGVVEDEYEDSTDEVEDSEEQTSEE